MATRILECGGTIVARTDGLPVYPQEWTAQAAMTATGTSAQSAAFASGTNLVVIDTDEQVYVKIGNNPTATTNDLRIPAGQRQEFTVTAGNKVAIRT